MDSISISSSVPASQDAAASSAHGVRQLVAPTTSGEAPTNTQSRQLVAPTTSGEASTRDIFAEESLSQLYPLGSCMPGGDPEFYPSEDSLVDLLPTIEGAELRALRAERRQEDLAARRFLVEAGGRYNPRTDRLVAVERDPARELAQRLNPVGAMFSHIMGGGNDRGLPAPVAEAARRAGCLESLAGRLPPPGVSVIQNALEYVEGRMNRQLVAPLHVYIGIMEAPVMRWLDHVSQARHRTHRQLQNMTLVEEATHSRQTAVTERALIVEARLRWRSLCLNIGPGGECASAASPHYCYVCWLR